MTDFEDALKLWALHKIAEQELYDRIDPGSIMAEMENGETDGGGCDTCGPWQSPPLVSVAFNGGRIGHPDPPRRRHITIQMEFGAMVSEIARIGSDMAKADS